MIYAPKGRKVREESDSSGTAVGKRYLYANHICPLSSHHFVKEGQEPAFLVIDAIADDHLMSLLEWSPTVVVLAPAYSKVASWGTRVDVVAYDQVAHSNIVIEGVVHAGPARIIDVNVGLAEAIFTYLRSIGQHALQVLVSDPAEHLNEWDVADFQISLIDKRVKWSRIRSGRFEKWMPDGDVLLIRAEGAVEVSGATFVAGQISVQHAGMVSLTSPSFFWIGEQHR